MKTLIKYFIPFSIAVLLWACNPGDENDASEAESPVTVENIRLKPIEQLINTNGTAYPMEKAEFKTEISGLYTLHQNPSTGKPFKLGDKVKLGDIIISIVDEEYENTIAINSKKLNLEISQNEYEKQKSLYEKGGVTLRELRNSEVSLTNAKYDYKNSLLKLEKMKIKAPFDGVITDLSYYTPASRLQTGQALVTIMNYSKMYVEINLPEKTIGQIKTGQPVRITNYNLPGDTLHGTVSELSPAISNETRTFKGMLLISNGSLKLRPGMFVNADIITNRKDKTIVIAKEMILTNEQGKYVFIVDKSAARQKIISTGLETAKEIEVIDGLQVNDRLIIKGYETLKDNSKIKVLK